LRRPRLTAPLARLLATYPDPLIAFEARTHVALLADTAVPPENRAAERKIRFAEWEGIVQSLVRNSPPLQRGKYATMALLDLAPSWCLPADDRDDDLPQAYKMLRDPDCTASQRERLAQELKQQANNIRTHDLLARYLLLTNGVPPLAQFFASDTDFLTKHGDLLTRMAIARSLPRWCPPYHVHIRLARDANALVREVHARRL
jgi:hypothetical protein